MVQGQIHMSLNNINVRDIYLKVTGYEEASWEERRSESYRDSDGEMRSRSHTDYYHDKNTFFKQLVPLNIGLVGYVSGQFTIPFAFQLPVGLPGIVCATHAAHVWLVSREF